MAISKKMAAKITSKGKKDSRRVVSNAELKEQGMSTDKGKNPVMTQGGFAKNAVLAMKLAPKKTGAKSTGKVTRTLKQVNQSVVARGGKPVKTYTKKAK